MRKWTLRDVLDAGFPASPHIDRFVSNAGVATSLPAWLKPFSLDTAYEDEVSDD